MRKLPLVLLGRGLDGRHVGLGLMHLKIIIVKVVVVIET
jgi:hypothetical protein